MSKYTEHRRQNGRMHMTIIKMWLQLQATEYYTKSTNTVRL